MFSKKVKVKHGKDLIKITDRLKNGEVLLMDGGTGSELQRRGVNVLKEATDNLEAWSATANIDNPDVVMQVHQDYLRVGADIIISNNFWTTPTSMERIGLRDQWRKYATAAARNAVMSRDNGNPLAYVAGGIAAPTLYFRLGINKPDVEIMGEESFLRDYAEHAQILVEEGADFILAEYVGYIADCVSAVKACATVGLPVFLGIRHVDRHGNMQFGESVETLCSELKGLPVDAVLIMCSNPEAITATLPKLVDAFDGHVGAYPNIGYNPTGPLLNQPTLTNQLPSSGPDILQVGTYTTSRVAEFALEWKNMGAQIIGGCCATGPEHIAAIKESII